MKKGIRNKIKEIRLEHMLRKNNKGKRKKE